MSSKKKIIIIAVSILAVLVFFVPIPTGPYKDGGTKEYIALTYKIVKWHRLTETEGIYGIYVETKVYPFPKNFKSIDALWEEIPFSKNDEGAVNNKDTGFSVELLDKGSDIKDVSISFKSIDLDAEKPYIEVEWKNDTKNEFIYGESFELEYLDNGKFKRCAKGTVAFNDLGIVLPAGATTTETYYVSQFDLSKEGTYRFKVRYGETDYLWFNFKLTKV